MTITAREVTQQVCTAGSHQLDDSLGKIEHCVGQLTDEQIWWRPRPEMNAIGNMLLHLSGNLRQWIVCGIGGAVDQRVRSAEFSRVDGIPKSTLLQSLQQTVREAQECLARTSDEGMLVARRIQGFDVTGWEAVFHTLPHFQGHTQEIICLTRLILGEAYQTAFVPQTREQGAP